jgi:sugar/nucleoside kinase (ribokinase family)
VANAAGALSVQQAGATGGLLDWKATADWIAQFRK